MRKRHLSDELALKGGRKHLIETFPEKEMPAAREGKLEIQKKGEFWTEAIVSRIVVGKCKDRRVHSILSERRQVKKKATY